LVADLSGTGAAVRVLLGLLAGWSLGTQFLAGHVVEKSLSVDNLFVFVIIIISTFAVPAEAQTRALTLGIALALALRGIFIAAGGRCWQCCCGRPLTRAECARGAEGGSGFGAGATRPLTSSQLEGGGFQVAAGLPVLRSHPASAASQTERHDHPLGVEAEIDHGRPRLDRGRFDKSCAWPGLGSIASW
jgi:hypothetical protein